MTFFTFGLGHATGTETSAEVLGGKGAGLVWMTAQGMPVPPGFVIPTTVWEEYAKKPKTTMKQIAKALPAYLALLEAHFGYKPLLSVRSGARVSCPGMMDTILNVGLDATTVPFWTERLGEASLRNSYHRLVTMYGSVVKGIRRQELEEATLEGALHLYGEFPSAEEQLLGAIEAVFKSWDNARADTYRKQHGIPRAWGTAVTVQAMVFGNLNDNSGTGVLFTRNVNTGEGYITGEFLVNAQGEDVVAGIRTPEPLLAMQTWNLPVYSELCDLVIGLEKAKKDVQDVEFTVQDGVLYLLQTRNAKRSAQAAVRIALSMVQEGLIDAQTAMTRVTAKQLDQAVLTVVDPAFTLPAAAKGVGASAGIVTGKPVFSSQEALACSEPCLLITHETTPDDIAGMIASVGVITMVGGETSHAAVVARGMNKPCIVGVGHAMDQFQEADVVSMNGATGQIWLHELPTVPGDSTLVDAFLQLVVKTTGIVPVVNVPPTGPVPAVLLVLGDQVLNTQHAVSVVQQTAAQVETLYLDLTLEAGSAEDQFFALFQAYNPVQRLLMELAAFPEPDLLKKLVVIGASALPFRTLQVVVDLPSFVLAEGEMMLGDGVSLADPAMLKVLAWKQSEGITSVSVGTYVPGVKSLVSVPQVLHAMK